MYTNEPCLGIFVENKASENNLYKHEVIPKKFLGIRTDIIESKIPTTLISSPYKYKDSNAPDIAILNSYKRPLQPGYSISNGGTLGAIVFDNNNNPYILSNSHVIANNNKYTIGTKITQPPFEGTSNITINDTVVAYLYKQVMQNFAPDFNVADCAIAKLLPNIKYTTEIYKIGTIEGISTPELGMEVQKVGASSGYTTSVIRYINSIREVSYHSNNSTKLYFNNCIVCGPMSLPGDSGSLVLDDDNYAIGLLFGGDDHSTILNPIDLVMDLLEVHF